MPSWFIILDGMLSTENRIVYTATLIFFAGIIVGYIVSGMRDQ